jgi:predicted TPR repeat methyltransferase
MTASEAILGQAFALEEAGNLRAALDLFRKATLLDPCCGRSWRHLGNLLRRLGELGAASECFERAVLTGDDADLNRFFLSAVGVGPVVPCAPHHFVCALFNQYAPRFEQHLVTELGYRAPQLLFELVANSGCRHFESGLDLGCGTGLAAKAFQGAVTRMCGVDLSEQMLNRAAATGLYERLWLSSIEEHLASRQEHFDLVLCCDTFIYVGDLSLVFEGVRRALAPGGEFGFTVEASEAEEGFDLLPSLRYAHSEKYIRQLASSHNLRIVGHREAPLRTEAGVFVKGLAFHVAKPEP